MAGRHTLVAEDVGEVLGFAELEPAGHIDMLYCRADAVRRGVGSALLKTLEDRARSLELTRLFTKASITARPFFARHGFQVMREVTVERGGVTLMRFAMEKTWPVTRIATCRA
jgi:N-acetylglutamate synthase-like GNAT family acetyltransferase